MITTIECAELFKHGDREEPWITGKLDVQYQVFRKESEIVIAFAESNSTEDWIHNFSTWLRPYKQMKVTFFVHAGFLKCWKANEDAIKKAIDKIIQPNDVITTTGWSFGATQALLCKEWLWFNYSDHISRCITFGSPRLLWFWNYNKVKERWNNTVELSNGSDPVNRVPFMIMGFRHCVKMTHIGDRFSWFKIFKTDYHLIKNYRKILHLIIKDDE